MDKNTMNVLIVLIIALVIICLLIAWMWIYTPYMGGYHNIGGTNGMMQGY